MVAVQHHYNIVCADKAAPLLVTTELPLVSFPLKGKRLKTLALRVPCLFLEQAKSMVCNLPHERALRGWMIAFLPGSCAFQIAFRDQVPHFPVTGTLHPPQNSSLVCR
jgi:hypothetical protein